MTKTIPLALLCCLLATFSYGQFGKARKRQKSPTTYKLKSKQNEKFLEKQWWVGLRAGTNWTMASVDKRYSVLYPTNYDPSTINKRYKNFSETGAQVALDINFYFKGFSVSLIPTYQRSRFVYNNSYIWASTAGEQYTLTLDYHHRQETDHAVFPLVVRYDLTDTKLRPYVQLGGFLSFLIDAHKSIHISGSDFSTGGENEFTDEPIEVGVKDLFAKTYGGLAGGFGLNYHQGNIRLNLDILYQYGLSNAVSTKNRYKNGQLVGVGDVLDDLMLSNIVISAGCMFPLRFLENGFKSM